MACGFGGPLAADLRQSYLSLSLFSLVIELSNQKKQKENQKEKRVREREKLSISWKEKKSKVKGILGLSSNQRDFQA